MSKINVLSFEIANLIAAGEVVERPASVMKELIENAIDAGSKNIIAEIKRGGVSMIRVSDDGVGIDKSDLPIALKRHATSKISEKDDLSKIMTLGFRGEALAAIASVCNLTIISKVKDAPEATMLTAEAGQVTDLCDVYAADGTTVVVNDLFYNVPARRKFLKKDSTEAMNVVALVEKVALSRPDISIQLLVDGEERFKTSGDGSLINAVYSIFGKDFSSKLIEVNGLANGIRVTGYIGRSDNVKKNRNLMNVFINGRYVKSLTAQAAIEKAYVSYIAPECFPCCILFIEISPSLVDVNVHPAKLEVKFSDERAVFETVYHTVREALQSHEYRPEMKLDKKNDRNLLGAYLPIDEKISAQQVAFEMPPVLKESSMKVGETRSYIDTKKTKSFFEDEPINVASSTRASYGERASSPTVTPRDSVELLQKYRKSREDTELFKKAEAQKTVIDSDDNNVEKSIDYRIIGEAFDCYVIVEYQNELLVIDKHAAHERVIFEDLKRSRKEDGRVSSQMLMLPVCFAPTPTQIDSLINLKDELTLLGFEYTIDNKVCEIKAIPDGVSSIDAESVLVQMIDSFADGTGTPSSVDDIRREKALYQIACKAAIKGGRKYDAPIIQWLVNKLLSLPDITVCPHGRPVAFKLSKRELDRQFDRIK